MKTVPSSYSSFFLWGGGGGGGWGVGGALFRFPLNNPFCHILA